MSYPVIAHAQVVSVQTPGKLICQSTSGAVPFPCVIGRHGHADAFRVSQKGMPTPGTWGIVAFPYGDERNGVWLCSYYSQMQDALTGDNDPGMEYDSHWSGKWEQTDGNGNHTTWYPDGTYKRIGTGTTLPVPTRHVVAPNGSVSEQPFNPSDRVTTPPSQPFDVYDYHASGTSTHTDHTGSITTSGAPSSTLTHTFNGTSFHIDATGNMTAMNAGAAMFTANFGGSTFTIDAGGNIGMTLKSGAKFNIGNGGSTGDLLVLAELLCTFFNAHIHDISGSVTTVPTVAMTPVAVSSDLIGTQS